MKYEDLIKAHEKYGTTKEDIIKILHYKDIKENVVIAPCWSHELFVKKGFELTKCNDLVYNFDSADCSFSFIEVNTVGAPMTMEYVLGLGLTKCKNLIFIGSTGSLDKNIKIGDVVIPECSISGDGASRYLNKNLEDSFQEKIYPTKELSDKAIASAKEVGVKAHNVINYSVDNIFSQFYFIDKFKELGSKTIDMESACVFKCANFINVNVCAIFNISDSTALNKSLYSGRTKKEQDIKRYTKQKKIPEIVINLLKKL